MGKLIRASINFITRSISAYFPLAPRHVNNTIKYDNNICTAAQQPGEGAGKHSLV